VTVQYTSRPHGSAPVLLIVGLALWYPLLDQPDGTKRSRRTAAAEAIPPSSRRRRPRTRRDAYPSPSSLRIVLAEVPDHAALNLSTGAPSSCTHAVVDDEAESLPPEQFSGKEAKSEGQAALSSRDRVSLPCAELKSPGISEALRASAGRKPLRRAPEALSPSRKRTPDSSIGARLPSGPLFARSLRFRSRWASSESATLMQGYELDPDFGSAHRRFLLFVLRRAPSRPGRPGRRRASTSLWGYRSRETPRPLRSLATAVAVPKRLRRVQAS
jgi:hypothetical protein